MAKQPDGFQQWALNASPRNEASGVTPTATGFTPATDFSASITFNGNLTPDDSSVLLDGLPLVKMTSLRQRAADLWVAIPSHEEVQAVRLTKTEHANRIAKLMKHRSEAGFGLDEQAPQVVAERKKLKRAEQELARLTELKEVRTVRWNTAGQLDRSVSDWLLRGGIPGDCVLEPIEDAPLSELLTKADGGRIDAAVERYRHRLRELAADLHRLKSAPWPSSVAKAAARTLIDRLADQGQPILDGAIEHGMDISFAQITTTSMVHNVEARGAVAYAETPDAIGLIAWLFRDQLLAKINAGFDEIADDNNSLDQAQREQMEAQINSDMLAVERLEVACIWHADAKGEQIDFRADTTPQAVLGVRLRTQSHMIAPGTSADHGYNIVGVRR